MTESSIVFLDSGIGGLPYLEWFSERNISRNLIYVADTAYFPYGELEEDQIKKVVVSTSDRIFRSLNPDILVIACNTASVSALDEVRKIAPCPVVGTVPAVKPAAEIPGSAPIGVLATQGTINSPYLDNLVVAFASNRRVVRQAAGDIVRYVEEDWLDSGESGAVEVMLPALEKLKQEKVESVVLGCTHFLHVVDAISSVMGSDVKMVDSRDGVGRRTLHQLGENDSSNAEKRDVIGTFYVTRTGNSDERYRRFASRYNLEWGGELS